MPQVQFYQEIKGIVRKKRPLLALVNGEGETELAGRGLPPAGRLEFRDVEGIHMLSHSLSVIREIK